MTMESSNCRNTYPDSKCESWARTDQCRVNPSFMLEHCKKSCKVCTGGGGDGSNNGGNTDQGKTDKGDCAENKHPNDQECEYWARRGECEANPSWMLQNCRKACKPEDCGSDKACVNDYGDDAQCSRWANRGECDNNPNWMLENCHKACNPKCVQKDTDACSKDGCRKGTCKNTYGSDKDCKWWAMDNQCETNPGWMLVNCAKACKCEEEDNETPQPGGKCSDPDGFCLQLGRRGKCTCGYPYLQNNNLQVQPSTNNSRPQPIIWGREARPNTWPWQASLQLKEGYSGYGEEIRWKHQCGGTLITPKWILTAAHCVYQPGFDNPVNWRVVLGEHRISQDSGKEEIRRVIRIIKHPQFYYYGGARNDIALLELDSDVPLGTYIQTACLASKNQCFHRNPNCFITGWGATLGTGDPDVLNEVRMEVRTKAECVREWSANRIFDTHICIGYGYQSACHGDSGGPLVCKVGSRYTLAGVTSWGPQGCQGQPSVYTRVSSYIDWITDVIRQLTY
ncbi:coagulation factor IX [Lingula anatina]|uniref:Coagulation factor IX n=1 Tax=Lingula anatina TaxID=7574 RepID=A0A2R2MM90_LINAN|nr:coagulation factor IX [Lingula anatina]|eukprot:XP_023931336.1 coagulation factor IX [Lingula anatina]